VLLEQLDNPDKLVIPVLQELQVQQEELAQQDQLDLPALQVQQDQQDQLEQPGKQALLV
jgi:hypothetical protein